MAKLSFRLGLALVILGVLSWVIAGFESPTALIPAFLGAPIAVCGHLTLKKPEKAVIFMHISVVLGRHSLSGIRFTYSLAGRIRFHQIYFYLGGDLYQFCADWSLCSVIPESTDGEDLLSGLDRKRSFWFIESSLRQVRSGCGHGRQPVQFFSG